MDSRLHNIRKHGFEMVNPKWKKNKQNEIKNNIKK